MLGRQLVYIYCFLGGGRGVGGITKKTILARFYLTFLEELFKELLPCQTFVRLLESFPLKSHWKLASFLLQPTPTSNKKRILIITLSYLIHSMFSGLTFLVPSWEQAFWKGLTPRKKLYINCIIIITIIIINLIFYVF